ncbi:hypothetical protein AA3266_0993 [Gluconobacter kondonii NBRC 3266]|nr:hypothetical protein AA3266_0993 [Gluconobacter kondonii NBRC 3266]
MGVGQAFAGIEARATIRNLNDDVRSVPGRCFQNGIHAVGADDINGGKGIAPFMAGLDKGRITGATDDAGWNS